MCLQGDSSTQELAEITVEEWDSLQSLICDDVSVKNELPSPMSTSSFEVPEVDSNIFPGVIVQPVSAGISVPAAVSVLTSSGTGRVVNGNVGNVNFVLNSKVKIQPKPISVLTTSASLPTLETGCVFSFVCKT